MIEGIVDRKEFGRILKNKFDIVDDSYDKDIDELYPKAVDIYNFLEKGDYESEEDMLDAIERMHKLYKDFEGKILSDIDWS